MFCCIINSHQKAFRMLVQQKKKIQFSPKNFRYTDLIIPKDNMLTKIK
jgi:hypothetical protein